MLFDKLHFSNNISIQSESESCSVVPTLCYQVDCNPAGSSVHGVGCHFLLQEIFPTQGSNLGLLELQAESLPFEPPGKPMIYSDNVSRAHLCQ